MLDLTVGATGAEEKAAHLEAERKVKSLDALSDKLEQADQEYLKKLDALEKEAEGAKNVAAVDRIWRMRGAIYRGEGREDRAIFEVDPSIAGGQATDFKMMTGHRYFFRSRGSWRTSAGPAIECTATGVKGKPWAPRGWGCLMVQVENGGNFDPMDSAGIVPTGTGILRFFFNLPSMDMKPQGKLLVMVERRD